MDVDAAGTSEGRAATLLGVAIALHPWHQREQVVPVADGERKVGHLELWNHRTQRGVVRVQQLRRLGDGDGLADGADFERRIHTRPLADFERDHLRHLLEPGLFHVDLILPRNQVD